MQVRGGNQVHKMCLSLQQWAFLFSVIVFVVTAVLTTCAALGKMHTQDVWELIKADLAEEQEKSYYEYDNKNGHLSSNEAKLQLSQHFVLMIIWILYVCTWVGCLNLSAAILMVYGIATKSSIYIIPWILISGTTYLLSISTILVAYLDMLPGVYISFNTLTISLASSTIFIVFWYTILLYYTTLTTNSCTARYPTITPTIIQAYGGYMHTVNPSLPNEKKQIV
ncbi:hypothetical protein ILUMI_09633 [Ignelater luminosus]|uniref:Uncharacterized protein n=1 Tax=Ignelater luminosus TaxID=2038154 RepID=A0A8K0D5F2_IGNLU|nr:hypothetical protein ILUMI_09633 [Ignelater luminosus]